MYFAALILLLAAFGSCHPVPIASTARAAPGPGSPPADKPPRPCVLGNDVQGPSYSVTEALALMAEGKVVGRTVRVHGIVHVEFEDTALYSSVPGDKAHVELLLSREVRESIQFCTRGGAVVTGVAGIWRRPGDERVMRAFLSPVVSIAPDDASSRTNVADASPADDTPRASEACADRLPLRAHDPRALSTADIVAKKRSLDRKRVHVEGTLFYGPSSPVGYIATRRAGRPSPNLEVSPLPPVLEACRGRACVVLEATVVVQGGVPANDKESVELHDAVVVGRLENCETTE